jgi:hypothetical protein
VGYRADRDMVEGEKKEAEEAKAKRAHLLFLTLAAFSPFFLDKAESPRSAYSLGIDVCERCLSRPSTRSEQRMDEAKEKEKETRVSSIVEIFGLACKTDCDEY